MKQLQALWNRLTAPRAIDNSVARQEYLTKAILVMMGLTLLVFTLPILIGWIAGPFELESVIIVLLLDLPVWGGWWLAERGRWRLASYVPPAILFVQAVYVTYVTAAFSVTGLLFAIIAVLLTGILHGNRAQWTMVLLCLVSYLGAAWVRGNYDLEDAISMAISVSGSLVGITLLHWLSSHLLQRALAQARAYATELQASTEKMRAMFESATDGIVFADLDGSVIECNQASLALHGFSSRDEVIGRNALEFVAAEDLERARENLYHALAAGGSSVIEYKLLRKDGSSFDGELSAVVLRNEQGEPTGIVALTRDVTERKQAEQELRASEQRYRSIIESIPMGMHMYQLDAQGRLIFIGANPAAEEILGVDNSQFIGKTIEEAFPPLGETEVPERYALAASHGKTWRSQQITYEDRQIAGSFEVYAFQTAPGMMTAAFWDVTERVRREAERIRLTTAIEQSAESIVITDTEGTILYVNPAFERTTGYSRAEAVGRNPRILNSGTQPADFYRELWTTITDGRVWHGRFVNRKKDGSLYTEDATISPVRDESGTLINYVAVKRDVTAELDLQERYHQAQKMEAIGRLASGIAHDFNNLLTAIMGYNRLLLDDLSSDNPSDWPPGSTIRADLQEIQRASNRASSLTQQLLAFSRKQVLQLQMLNLNNVLDDMQEMLQRLIGEDIALVTLTDPRLAYIKADRGQIEQVIMNLAVNAHDAMPTGGQLVFKTANQTLDRTYTQTHPEIEPGAYVTLTVSDNGVGMSQEIKSHLFEPFFTTKEQGKGTGLGLATVYGIVEQVGGHIDVQSEIGEGTTFTIYLPQTEQVDLDIVHREPAQDLLVGSETILLVEDEEIVRDLASRILTQQGYRLLTASHAEEALRMSAEHAETIHLLVTDVVMPGAGGKDLADRIQTLRPETRILYISGYTDDAIGRKGVLEPGTSLLQKPFTPIELARKVRQVLDTS